MQAQVSGANSLFALRNLYVIYSGLQAYALLASIRTSDIYSKSTSSIDLAVIGTGTRVMLMRHGLNADKGALHNIRLTYAGTALTYI